MTYEKRWRVRGVHAKTAALRYPSFDDFWTGWHNDVVERVKRKGHIEGESVNTHCEIYAGLGLPEDYEPVLKEWGDT